MCAYAVYFAFCNLRILKQNEASTKRIKSTKGANKKQFLTFATIYLIPNIRDLEDRVINLYHDKKIYIFDQIIIPNNIYIIYINSNMANHLTVSYFRNLTV